jgi:multiple sugar transport system permease protein
MTAIPRGKISRLAIVNNLTSYAFLAPSLIFFIVFMIIPLLWTLNLSMFEGGILGQLKFVGFENYLTIFKNSLFVVSLKNTARYVFMVIPSVIIISLFIASLIVDKYIRGKNLFKSMIFLPQLSPMVTCAVLWTFMIHPEFGLINYVLNWIGINNPNWLGDPKVALITITLLELWRGIGFYVVTYVAALLAVPDEIYDAAMVDGATGLTKFFTITLPLIRPTLLFTLVMATIWNFQLFDSVYVLTRGGPANTTSTVVWYIYDNAFRYERIGRASTMAVLLMLIILVLSVIEMKYLRSDYEY